MEAYRKRFTKDALAERLRKLSRSRAIHVLVPAAIIAAIYWEGRREIARIDWRTTWGSIRGMDMPSLLLLAACNLAAVASVCSYDFILRWRYRVPIGRWTTFRFAWIANTSNSVIGVAGLAGAGLRTLLYRRRGVPLRTVATWIAFLSTITVTGLSLLSWAGIAGLLPIRGMMAAHPWIRWIVWGEALSLPVLILIQRSRRLAAWIRQERKPVDGVTIFASVAASLLEWLLAGTAFWLVAARLLPGISLEDGLAVYLVSSVAGLVSMAPGGIGGFDLTALMGLAGLGWDSGASAAVLMLYRVMYYLFPWLIGLVMAAIEFAAVRGKTRPAAVNRVPPPHPNAKPGPASVPLWTPTVNQDTIENRRDDRPETADGPLPNPTAWAGETQAEEPPPADAPP
ncbi:lysylphosphatidylglycerol synthase domain-containing protein [Cohnella caldifontis]|uniref:lysylphosphatidylglycerol synthase domain-containing protein n=1 Tax=Cohnella caldifontis TaxID=3027471 RepID=UPI0023EC4BE0|nr:lysylphosphatidylglycerol synthase domain-containing protein [Cohnella sp. YIM B05605]